ncbi:alpha/beta hydrolase [Nocardiopsis xinjiangensis]|uniref:alpha/beta hydrolase n=1 Tax=Nocardiopsis xinjiangensis TaxID=124285 RepID=UPI0003610F87|nr:alpha/beta hydrolase [Nocardiopsis xinjiangensis]
MTLDLPDPIEAEPEKIRSGADDLDELHNDMLGRSGDTDNQMRSSADQFTDRIGWDISSASADDLMAWEEASKALTYGAGVLRLWAEDIDTYMTDRASIETRWETAKQEMRDLRVSGGSGYAIGQAVTEWLGGENTEVAALEQTREDLRSEHAGIWGTLMDQAEQTKIDLRTGPSQETMERMVEAGLLTAGQIATYGDHYPAMVPDEIDGSEPPHLVNAWWESLSEDEREQAMADDPDLLRDLDGIPSNVRDQLNRDHLEDDHEAVQDELEELRGDLADAPNGPGGSFERTSLSQEIRELEEQEEIMATLRDDLGDSANESDQYLLAFARGEHGRAIVSHGNPDTADNVSTMVPGTTNNWENVNGRSGNAAAVAAEANRTSESEQTAVISWIGYDAPSTTEAPFEERAEAAVDELSRFQSGLRDTHEGASPSHNTVIGHSYGSTVVGHTAMSDQGLDADQIAFVGSPGVNAEHVSELGFLPEDVHVSTAENDKINDRTPEFVHGPDPSDEEFGATTFESDEGTEGGAFPFGDAHSEYYDPPEDPEERSDQDASGKSVEYLGEFVRGIL